MDLDVLDIYDDLDDFHEEEQKKSKELLTIQSKYEEAVKECENKNGQIKDLNKKIKIMQKNFYSLLETAKSEIRRKDQTIQDLRRDLDNIYFRRQSTYQPKQIQQHTGSEESPNCAPNTTTTKYIIHSNVTSSQNVTEIEEIVTNPRNPFHSSISKNKELHSDRNHRDKAPVEIDCQTRARHHNREHHKSDRQEHKKRKIENDFSDSNEKCRIRQHGETDRYDKDRKDEKKDGNRSNEKSQRSDKGNSRSQHHSRHHRRHDKRHSREKKSRDRGTSRYYRDSSRSDDSDVSPSHRRSCKDRKDKWHSRKESNDSYKATSAENHETDYRERNTKNDCYRMANDNKRKAADSNSVLMDSREDEVMNMDKEMEIMFTGNKGIEKNTVPMECMGAEKICEVEGQVKRNSDLMRNSKDHVNDQENVYKECTADDMLSTAKTVHMKDKIASAEEVSKCQKDNDSTAAPDDNTSDEHYMRQTESNSSSNNKSANRENLFNQEIVNEDNDVESKSLAARKLITPKKDIYEMLFGRTPIKIHTVSSIINQNVIQISPTLSTVSSFDIYSDVEETEDEQVKLKANRDLLNFKEEKSEESCISNPQLNNGNNHTNICNENAKDKDIINTNEKNETDVHTKLSIHAPQASSDSCLKEINIKNRVEIIEDIRLPVKYAIPLASSSHHGDAVQVKDRKKECEQYISMLSIEERQNAPNIYNDELDRVEDDIKLAVSDDDENNDENIMENHSEIFQTVNIIEGIVARKSNVMICERNSNGIASPTLKLSDKQLAECEDNAVVCNKNENKNSNAVDLICHDTQEQMMSSNNAVKDSDIKNVETINMKHSIQCDLVNTNKKLSIIPTGGNDKTVKIDMTSIDYLDGETNKCTKADEEVSCNIDYEIESNDEPSKEGLVADGEQTKDCLKGKKQSKESSMCDEQTEESLKPNEQANESARHDEQPIKAIPKHNEPSKAYRNHNEHSIEDRLKQDKQSEEPSTENNRWLGEHCKESSHCDIPLTENTLNQDKLPKVVSKPNVPLIGDSPKQDEYFKVNLEHNEQLIDEPLKQHEQPKKSPKYDETSETYPHHDEQSIRDVSLILDSPKHKGQSKDSAKRNVQSIEDKIKSPKNAEPSKASMKHDEQLIGDSPKQDKQFGANLTKHNENSMEEPLKHHEQSEKTLKHDEPSKSMPKHQEQSIGDRSKQVEPFKANLKHNENSIEDPPKHLDQPKKSPKHDESNRGSPKHDAQSLEIGGKHGEQSRESPKCKTSLMEDSPQTDKQSKVAPERNVQLKNQSPKADEQLTEIPRFNVEGNLKHDEEAKVNLKHKAHLIGDTISPKRKKESKGSPKRNEHSKEDESTKADDESLYNNKQLKISLKRINESKVTLKDDESLKRSPKHNLNQNIQPCESLKKNKETKGSLTCEDPSRESPDRVELKLGGQSRVSPEKKSSKIAKQKDINIKDLKSAQNDVHDKNVSKNSEDSIDEENTEKPGKKDPVGNSNNLELLAIAAAQVITSVSESIEQFKDIKTCDMTELQETNATKISIQSVKKLQIDEANQSSTVACIKKSNAIIATDENKLTVQTTQPTNNSVCESIEGIRAKSSVHLESLDHLEPVNQSSNIKDTKLIVASTSSFKPKEEEEEEEEETHEPNQLNSNENNNYNNRQNATNRNIYKNIINISEKIENGTIKELAKEILINIESKRTKNGLKGAKQVQICDEGKYMKSNGKNRKSSDTLVEDSTQNIKDLKSKSLRSKPNTMESESSSRMDEINMDQSDRRRSKRKLQEKEHQNNVEKLRKEEAFGMHSVSAATTCEMKSECKSVEIVKSVKTVDSENSSVAESSAAFDGIRSIKKDFKDETLETVEKDGMTKAIAEVLVNSVESENPNTGNSAVELGLSSKLGEVELQISKEALKEEAVRAALTNEMNNEERAKESIVSEAESKLDNHRRSKPKLPDHKQLRNNTKKLEGAAIEINAISTASSDEMISDEEPQESIVSKRERKLDCNKRFKLKLLPQSKKLHNYKKESREEALEINAVPAVSTDAMNSEGKPQESVVSEGENKLDDQRRSKRDKKYLKEEILETNAAVAKSTYKKGKESECETKGMIENVKNKKPKILEVVSQSTAGNFEVITEAASHLNGKEILNEDAVEQKNQKMKKQKLGEDGENFSHENNRSSSSEQVDNKEASSKHHNQVMENRNQSRKNECVEEKFMEPLYQRICHKRKRTSCNRSEENLIAVLTAPARSPSIPLTLNTSQSPSQSNASDPQYLTPQRPQDEIDHSMELLFQSPSQHDSLSVEDISFAPSPVLAAAPLLITDVTINETIADSTDQSMHSTREVIADKAKETKQDSQKSAPNIRDSIAHNSSSESRSYLIGSSQYVVEKASENEVSFIITRRRTKKRKLAN